MTEPNPEGRKDEDRKEAEPRGLGEHVRGLASEYAHEQGWGLNEEERTKVPEGKQDTDGGTNYNYGAREFGDEPTNLDRLDIPGDHSPESKQGEKP